MFKIVAAALMLLPGGALAQASQCSLPPVIERPHIEGATDSEPRRVLPIGSYTLAISWSPQYCANAKGGSSTLQCSGRNGRFGFTLHGLWPDGYGEKWPQYCKATGLVPRAVIKENLCVTPSVQLIQHEWEKHGTCTPMKPDRFFDTSRRFYQALRFPDMAALAKRDDLTVGKFAEAFAAVNAGIKADMMRVTTTRDNMLSEVWLCMDRKMKYARCPAHQGGSPETARLRITPQA